VVLAPSRHAALDRAGRGPGLPGTRILAVAPRAVGNTLSWAYTVEWPFFAAYGVYMWWRIVHEQPTEPPHASQATVAAQGRPTELPDLHEEEDEELAAYNRYLAQLNAADEQKLR